MSNPPHRSYKLSDQFMANGSLLGVVVWFSSGELTSVSLFVATGAQNWGEWSEPEEFNNRDDLEQLLTSTYDGDRVFSWGTLSAAYDPRSGSSALTVGYAK